MMDITVRLYKLHDYDLIYLYKNLHYPIKDAMKRALTAYVRDEPVFFDFPITEVSADQLETIKRAQFHIILDDETDSDIIEYLSSLKRFYRNSFLKNLLRGYLTGPVAYIYENQPDIETSKKRSDSIKDSMLGIETLKLMKPRKKKRDYIILTTAQKELLEKTGILEDMEVIIHD